MIVSVELTFGLFVSLYEISNLESLKAKISDLQSDLDSVQKLYENETLQRVDFENKLQSVKEELMFKERLFREVSRCL